MTRRGFTLVELLVVVGIIALLVGLLLPVLGSARRSGEAAVCGSNLRQLHAAVVLYANDHGGRAPAGAAIFFDGSRPAESNLRRWHGHRDDDDSPFDATRGPLWSYLQTDEIKRCPSFLHDELDDNPGQAGASKRAPAGTATTTSTSAETCVATRRAKSATVLPAFETRAARCYFRTRPSFGRG